jgi:hypothetical protein
MSRSYIFSAPCASMACCLIYFAVTFEFLVNVFILVISELSVVIKFENKIYPVLGLHCILFNGLRVHVNISKLGSCLLKVSAIVLHN